MSGDGVGHNAGSAVAHGGNGHALGRIAVVCIAKSEDYYLYEWLDYHFRLGFDDAYVYTNDWEYTGALPDTEGHAVSFIPWPGRRVQLAAYNDFIARFASRYDWAAFIDVDEYIANNTGRPFRDVLSGYSCQRQLAVNWRIMGDSGITSFDPSYTSLAMRFTMGGRMLNHHVKQLVNLRVFRDAGCAMPSFRRNPHCTTEGSVCCDGTPVAAQFNEHGLDTVQPLELYHYLVKTKPEFEGIRIPRGRADSLRPYDIGGGDYGRESYNLNEAEFTTVKQFYSLVTGGGHAED